MEHNAFAFILHSKNVEELKKSYPLFRMVPDFVLKRSFRGISPFKVSQVKDLRSLRTKEVSGFFIDCPVLAEDGQPAEERLVLGKIFSAAAMAKRMGAKILGMDGCAGLFKERHPAIARHLYLPFTNGSAFTAWSIFEAIYRVAKEKGVDLKKASVAVIAADELPGNLCAKKLCEYARKIILCGKDVKKLEALKEAIENLSSADICLESSRPKAVREADITIISGSDPGFLNDISNLDDGKIICYLCLPEAHLLKLKSFEGVTAVEAGLVKLPYPLELPFHSGLPKDVVSAALAETILLALEGRFVNYSCGEDINPDKLEEIADIAAKHGFEVWVPEAPLI